MPRIRIPPELLEPEPEPQPQPQPRRHGFQKGQSGNPNGRPKGARTAATILREQIMQAKTPAILRKMISLALSGDTAAAKLILERSAPKPRVRLVELALPPVRSVADLPAALGAITAAVAAGELAADEGYTIAQLLDAQRAAFETADLAARVAALEAQMGSEAA